MTPVSACDITLEKLEIGESIAHYVVKLKLVNFTIMWWRLIHRHRCPTWKRISCWYALILFFCIGSRHCT